VHDYSMQNWLASFLDYWLAQPAIPAVQSA